jgi:type IV pilus modification protein PilV
MYFAGQRKTGNLAKGKQHQQGYSLVEVMVAILILTIGLLALAKMQTQAVASNSFGSQLTQATFLAQDKLEELRLLNECYLAVLAKPELGWTVEDQDVVDNYNSQLSDAVDNWNEDDGPDADSIPDQFSWDIGTPDHTNSDGPGGIANPIDVTGATATTGGYQRTWYVVDHRPVTKAKTVRVRVEWGVGRELALDTVLSQ